MEKAKIIGVRFDKETAEVLDRVARDLGIDRSDFIRMCIEYMISQLLE